MAGGTLASGLFAHRAPLLRYLRARGAADEAEDVLQELWLKLQDVQPENVADERAYLYRMAQNLLIDRRRGAMRRERRERQFYESAELGPAPNAERVLVARDELERIGWTLRDLGQRTEHIFRRHRLDHVPQKEIADELGISLSAVEKHLQRAYRAIASRVTEQDENDKTRGRVDAKF